jgi:hypothetical protein
MKFGPFLNTNYSPSDDLRLVTCSSWTRRQLYHERVGINHFSLVVNWPGMDQCRVLRSIELLGERVLPKLRSL